MRCSVIVGVRHRGERHWDASAVGGTRWVRGFQPASGATADEATERLSEAIRARWPEHEFTFRREGES